MRIAVAYDNENGNVWQHFGRTESFKVYVLEGSRIVASEIVDTNGEGHGALVDLLSGLSVDALICGGLGDHILQMMRESGIQVIPGVTGNADEAVEKYLMGELSANEEAVHSGCHHAEEEEEACGGCGGGCGGCGGGCHTLMEGPNSGKKVRVHYTGTFNNGEKFDSSYDRGEPLEFICGAGMMIKGFDKAVIEMKVGEIRDVHLEPSEAYGETDPDAVMTLKISDLPGSEKLNVGDRVALTNMYGQQFPVTVTAKDEENITLDANHEMAGKELNFRIELVEIED